MSGKDYMAEYRDKHPEYVERQNKRTRARQQADQLLRRGHMKEWSEIYQQQLKELGVEDA